MGVLRCGRRARRAAVPRHKRLRPFAKAWLVTWRSDATPPRAIFDPSTFSFLERYKKTERLSNIEQTFPEEVIKLVG
jgi:hypothetical protein